MSDGDSGSIVGGMIWMFVISVLLFWLPFIGALIAGVVGGRKAGGVGNAIVAVFLPTIVLGVAMFFAASMLTGLPVIGALAAAGGMVLAAVGVGPLLLGAIIGGVLA